MAAAVDLLDLIKEHAGGQFERKSRVHGGEYAGPCPWCGGTDRFCVWPGDDFPHYWCRGCGERGGVAHFLVKKLSLTWEDARRVEAEGLDISNARKSAEGARSPETTQAGVLGAPCMEWQWMAQRLVRMAAAALHREDGDAPRVMRYLQGPRRGLSPETIDARHLGYIPQDWYCNPEEWGMKADRDIKKVFVPRGILIPYESDGQIWGLKVRRLTDEKKLRFVKIAGSANALYGADTLVSGACASLSESEFDAMVAMQNAPGAAHCATGGTDGAREPRWLAKLAMAEAVVVTYDPDSGGDERAAWWLSRLKNSARLRPVGGDLTRMHCAGEPLLGPWLTAGIERAQAALVARSEATGGNIAPSATSAQEPTQSALPSVCFWCKASDATYRDHDGRPWCDYHAPVGAVNRQTGEVCGERDMSVGSGMCYWCGSPQAVVDPHGRPWCARHLPGVFDGTREPEVDEPLPEDEEESAPHHIANLDALAAVMREDWATMGADYSTPTQGAGQALPVAHKHPLPPAPSCSATRCRGQSLTYDCLGNAWCAGCALRAEMIDAGAAAGWFPNIAWGTTQHTGEGEESWVLMAKTLSRSACRMVIRAARGEPSIVLALATTPQEVA